MEAIKACFHNNNLAIDNLHILMGSTGKWVGSFLVIETFR